MKNYSRIYLEKIEKELFTQKIIVLIGSRRVGKTSILKILKEKEKRKSLFIDLDIESNKKILGSYENFLDYIFFYREEGEEIVVFLDEFQTVKNSGKILKNIYDNNPEIKLIISGSSSLDILSELGESLAGRKRVFNIFGLSFEEFLVFSEGENFLKLFKKTQGKDLIPSDIEFKINTLFKDFLIYGFYPEVSLIKNKQSKKDELSDIYSSYIKNDIKNFFNLKNIDGFTKILQFLAINTGNILNKNELSSFSGVNLKTLNDYLKILENTFVIKLIKPFFTNKNKEISKSPKIYFLDNGIRNFILNNFEENLDIRLDKGILFEQYFFSELMKKYTNLEIKYWNEKGSNEIDFIYEKDGEINLFEIKSNSNFKTSYLNGLNKFEQIYKNNFAKINKFLVYSGKVQINEDFKCLNFLNLNF